ncbi:RrF2 family transcriptional regulator [Methylophaga sp. OBS1]|uniref:RrF2 family transcriptional regulator n=1 Tax=Methylophaga sp. OBS1 TaxID=2991933 RepID=UPI002257FDAC|nr:Rrf2 family transcriptional regulator [Methylophaga sp. OBS1]MCX4192733.1 Rrf2 family transcriptional regulator [Methylophaga sp. OBS1]
MHLTTFSDYSMRVLMYLAVQPGQRVTIGDIAGRYQISDNHLTKVVHFLAKAGYIKTIRGKGGGLMLNRSVEEINLGEVIRKTEGAEGLLPCVQGQGDCCLIPVCKLTGILRESQQAMYQVLDKYTLADLLVDKAPLRQILMPN